MKVEPEPATVEPIAAEHDHAHHHHDHEHSTAEVNLNCTFKKSNSHIASAMINMNEHF